MKFRSITRRVVILFILVEILSALCMTSFVYFYERHTHLHSLDEAIRGRADLLMGAVVDADDVSDNVLLDSEGLQLPEQDLYEVWDNGNHLLGRSLGGIAPGLLRERTSPADSAGGWSLVTLGGVQYRLLRMTGLRKVDPAASGIRHDIVVLYASPTRPAWIPVAHAVRAFALASLVLVLCSSLVVTLLVRSSMSPLKELAVQAGAISSSRWSFVPSPHARTTEELAPLVAALEDLVRRLQLSFNQQRQFLSDSAHELKTAVTVVKSSLQLMDLLAREPEEYRAGVVTSLADCQRLEDLVYRMLTLARVEESGSLARAGAVGPTDLLAGVHLSLQAVESLARLRGVYMEVEGRSSAAAVGEEDWQTICVNLMSNSVLHSPSGSRVLVTVGQEGEHALCRIVDEGVGIAPEALPFVCDRFYRSDDSRARATGGSGLGLAICKALVERVGGRLLIESSLGEGTTATVRLPRAHGSTAAQIVPLSAAAVPSRSPEEQPTHARRA